MTFWLISSSSLIFTSICLNSTEHLSLIFPWNCYFFRIWGTAGKQFSWRKIPQVAWQGKVCGTSSFLSMLVATNRASEWEWNWQPVQSQSFTFCCLVWQLTGSAQKDERMKCIDRIECHAVYWTLLGPKPLGTLRTMPYRINSASRRGGKYRKCCQIGNKTERTIGTLF